MYSNSNWDANKQVEAGQSRKVSTIEEGKRKTLGSADQDGEIGF
jgi:hypothetical protein